MCLQNLKFRTYTITFTLFLVHYCPISLHATPHPMSISFSRKSHFFWRMSKPNLGRPLVDFFLEHPRKRSRSGDFAQIVGPSTRSWLRIATLCRMLMPFLVQGRKYLIKMGLCFRVSPGLDEIYRDVYKRIFKTKFGWG
jgi:hypothetical protein